MLAFKIYRDGVYLASCRFAVDAARFVGMCGPGAIVKYQHLYVLWREGHEEVSARERPATAAALIDVRKRQRIRGALPEVPRA